MPDDALGVYISIPFCRSKCTYCNFASGVYPAGDHARYVERLVTDMTSVRAWTSQRGVHLPQRVDTIYLGGGTPSLLEPELIVRLFTALRSEFSVNTDAEITVECAPGQLADATLAALASVGVNRVSLGVQSFIDAEAHQSGRLHNRAMVLDDLRRLRSAGIANLNVDLIAGLAAQTFASWTESLDTLIACDLPHASVYMLEVDEDSRLGRELLAGGARYRAGLVPSDDAIARMYELAIDRLADAGLDQYEISNFARPGFASQHNLRYWDRRPYLGLGLDASSMAFAANEVPPTALRWKTTDDLKSYLAASPDIETTWLSHPQQHEEAWFLGLRKNAGVPVAGLEREFGHAPVAEAMHAVRRLQQDGLLTFDGKAVRLTPRGRLLSNDVFQEFLGLQSAAELIHPAHRN
jgi:oxygen-independent coproporphyrinogen-3 oxidase